MSKADGDRGDLESTVRRNPHPDFKQVESSRPDWPELNWTVSKTRNPGWRFGQGATDGGQSLTMAHVEIDPYEEGRKSMSRCSLRQVASAS